MTARRLISLLGVVLVVGGAVGAAAGRTSVCTRRVIFEDGTPRPRTMEWRYPVGTKLRGAGSFDLDDDGRPERLTVVAEVEKDYPVNLSTGERSRERFCWFSTRLEIRDERRRLIYVDNWAIKDDDMAALLMSLTVSG